jgi:hypothetical protein
VAITRDNQPEADRLLAPTVPIPLRPFVILSSRCHELRNPETRSKALCVFERTVHDLFSCPATVFEQSFVNGRPLVGNVTAEGAAAKTEIHAVTSGGVLAGAVGRYAIR